MWRSFLFQSPKQTEFSLWHGLWIICVNGACFPVPARRHIQLPSSHRRDDPLSGDELQSDANVCVLFWQPKEKGRFAMARYSSCGTDTWSLQAQVYAFIAATGQMYRLFLPIPVWVAFYNQKEFGRTAFAFGHHWG